VETQPATSPSRGGRWYLLLRSLASVIDYAVYGALCFAYVYRFGTQTDDGYQVNGCGHLFLLFSAWAVWFPLPEFWFGKTFGKWACDLRVVNLSDGPISLGQAFARRLLDPVDLGGFFGLVAFIVAKTNPLNQRVGDLVAKTRVIEEPISQPVA
jgi:uncharacterized RDD family membrane protein YckC